MQSYWQFGLANTAFRLQIVTTQTKMNITWIYFLYIISVSITENLNLSGLVFKMHVRLPYKK